MSVKSKLIQQVVNPQVVFMMKVIVNVSQSKVTAGKVKLVSRMKIVLQAANVEMTINAKPHVIK